jgi:hypothetical protein
MSGTDPLFLVALAASRNAAEDVGRLKVVRDRIQAELRGQRHVELRDIAYEVREYALSYNVLGANAREWERLRGIMLAEIAAYDRLYEAMMAAGL